MTLRVWSRYSRDIFRYRHAYRYRPVSAEDPKDEA